MDRWHDIVTARHGGIHSCAVLTGYNDAVQLRASQPDLIVEHLGELQHLMQQHDMELAAQASGPATAPKPSARAAPK